MQYLMVLNENSSKWEQVMLVSFHCGYMGHFDYSGLRECLERIEKEASFQGKFHVISLLRDPVKRFASEFRFIQKHGIIWKLSTNSKCNNDILFTSCYPNKNHVELSLNDFILCKNNAATNRQTRMLADYKNDCSLLSTNKKKILIENAKKVLMSFTFFGLTEYEDESEELFIWTYKRKFKFSGRPRRHNQNATNNFIKTLKNESLEMINQSNDLDIELYQFAKKIFFQRLNSYRNISV